MAVSSVLYATGSDEWETPSDLFTELNLVFNFELDTAATVLNTKCAHFYTQEDDALKCDWKGRVWCNPPYSKAKEFIRKGYEESVKHEGIVVMLVAARTDTRIWHDVIFPHAAEIHFIKGRLKFGSSRNTAPFPSAIIVFDPKRKSEHGQYIGSFVYGK